MKLARLVEIAADEPVFESGLLLAGDVDPADVQRQLSRWTAAGQIIQLRRGLYAFCPPYRKVVAHPFLLANALRRPSYVSFESALSYHGLIPEHVQVTVSATTGRSGSVDTKMGAFAFHHVLSRRFWGYDTVDLAGQQVFVASPEKALMDLVFLRPGGDRLNFLQELRLQNLDTLNAERLQDCAERGHSPKLLRATHIILKLAAQEMEDYEPL